MYDDLKSYLADHHMEELIGQQSISRCAYGGEGWDVEWVLLSEARAYTRQEV